LELQTDFVKFCYTIAVLLIATFICVGATISIMLHASSVTFWWTEE